MIDEKLKYNEDLLDSYQGKWMNLYFLKTGESYPGSSIHDTKEMAKKFADGVYNRKDPPNLKLYRRICSYLGRTAYVHERSHAIQMPTGDT